MTHVSADKRQAYLDPALTPGFYMVRARLCTASAWHMSDKVTVVDVEIDHCPANFVPGHANTITYQIIPDACDAAPYGKVEIFKTDENGNAVGEAVFSDTDIDTSGGSHDYEYSGTDINWQDGKYILRVSVGESDSQCATDESPFVVDGYSLYYFFLDQLDNGYASGIDKSTVSNALVSISVWYYDETGEDAAATSMGTIDDVANMDASLCTTLGISKEDYVAVGGVYALLSDTFYGMSEEDQYFYMKVVVSSGGVLDKAGNTFDADGSTTALESTIKYKMRISSGTVQILEETYE